MKSKYFNQIISKFAKALLIVIFTVPIACCSSNVKGIYHVVRSGETLKDIGENYNVSPEEISRINRIKNTETLKEGKVLFIPQTGSRITNGKPQKKDPQTPKKVVTAKKTNSTVHTKEKQAVSDAVSNKHHTQLPEEKPPKITPEVDKTRRESPGKVEFIWPIKGKVTSRYGLQPDGTIHNHICITTQSDNSVHAAASGKVIFSNFLKDFGGTIIIKHDERYATVYTHLKHLKVRTGQRVKKGEIIGTASPSNRKGESFIHFEIRYNNKPQNPLSFLPG
ncbi:MAG: M23 family metallopeptidase [Syntrophales bacterium]|nr:M23 family metallopeptidase [Syntrophales bacterium]